MIRPENPSAAPISLGKYHLTGNAAGRRKRRRWLAAAIIVLTTPVALGHPLGNDNVEHFSVLWIMPDRLEVDLLLFIAETQSTIVQREEMDTDKDGVDTAEEQKAWLNKKAKEFEGGLRATIDGKELRLDAVEEAIDPATGRKAVASRIIMKMPGYADMPTYRLLIRYAGRYPEPLAAGRHTIVYEDATFGRSPGIRRIMLEPIREIEVFPPHPEFWGPDTNPFQFEQYDPADLPQERQATVTFRVVPSPGEEIHPAATTSAPAGEAVVPPSTSTAPAQPQPLTVAEATASTAPAGELPSPEGPVDLAAQRAGFTQAASREPGKFQRQALQLIALLRGEWGLVMVVTVTVLSFGWGAAHALMPGHAKTVVAAYLISQRGTYWHAVLLAIIVTITHTALVVLIGLVWALYQAKHPELGPKLQPWLGVVSGILVAAMGGTLIWRVLSGRLGRHHHDHHHPGPDDDRPWWRKLFTHSHPHLPAQPQGLAHAHHDHAGARGHDHDHAHSRHDHADGSGHIHDHAHAYAHAHAHPHGHAHAHDHAQGHNHSHARDHAAGRMAPSVSDRDRDKLTVRLLVVLGVTGGIVPCPTATIIMFLGIGAKVVVGALYAVAIFSLGLALTLMLVGFLALSSRRFAARLLRDVEHEGELSGRGRWVLLGLVPTLSGAAVIVLGGLIAANYLHHIAKGSALFTWLG